MTTQDIESGNREYDPFVEKHLKRIKEKMAEYRRIFILENRLKHLQHPPFNASIQYFLETGKINGNFLQALENAMQDYAEWAIGRESVNREANDAVSDTTMPNKEQNAG